MRIWGEIKMIAERGWSRLFGLEETNDTLFITIQAGRTINLIKQYQDSFPDEFHASMIKRRVPYLRRFYHLFAGFFSDKERERQKRILEKVEEEKYFEINKEDLVYMSDTIKRFSKPLIKEQQKDFELLRTRMY